MIYLFIYIFLAICSFIFKRSKFVLYLLMSLLFIMTVFSQAGNDINNIRDFYDYNVVTSDLVERSSLFAGIVLLSSNVGISFTLFRVIQFLIWCLVLYKFIKRYSIFPNLVFSCCFLFPLCGFGAQFRNGLMVGFLYLAIFCLISMKKKKGVILFVLLIIFASRIHSLALMYLCLLAIHLPISTEKLTKICVIGCIALYGLLNYGGLLGIITNYLGEYNSQYFTSTTGANLTMLILFFGIIANTILSYHFSNIILKQKSLFSTKQIEYAYIVPRINIVLASLMPFLSLSLNFYRIFQNVFILTVVLAINSIHIKHPSKNIELLVYLSLYFLITVFYIHWQGEFMVFLNGIHL